MVKNKTNPAMKSTCSNPASSQSLQLGISTFNHTNKSNSLDTEDNRPDGKSMASKNVL